MAFIAHRDYKAGNAPMTVQYVGRNGQIEIQTIPVVANSSFEFTTEANGDSYAESLVNDSFGGILAAGPPTVGFGNFSARRRLKLK